MERRHRLGHERERPEHLLPQLHPTGLDAGEVEQVVDDRLEALAVLARREHEIGLLRGERADDRNELEGAADAVVLPYLSATQSGIIQIAYNFDKPVIATNVGGLAEVVIDGKTGFIVPPDNAPALAKAITRYYGEKREQEFSANVKTEKQKYTWDNLVATIEQLAAPKK